MVLLPDASEAAAEAFAVPEKAAAADAGPSHHPEAIEPSQSLAKAAEAVHTYETSGNGWARGEAVLHGEDDITALSQMLNGAFYHLNPEHTQSWYKVFNEIDWDDTGRISCDEFILWLRSRLKLLSGLERLRAAWPQICQTGELLTRADFGRFMRRGEVQLAASENALGLQARRAELQQAALLRTQNATPTAREARAVPAPTLSAHRPHACSSPAAAGARTWHALCVGCFTARLAWSSTVQLAAHACVCATCAVLRWST